MGLGRKYLLDIGFQGSKTINYQRKKEMKRKIWNEWTIESSPSHVLYAVLVDPYELRPCVYIDPCAPSNNSVVGSLGSLDLT
jgi:hypothetical protein